MPRLLFFLAFLLPTAAVFGSWAHGVRHTLSNNPDWVSVKPTLERGVMGSTAYLTSPIALAGDRLNTGPWHGYQQLMSGHEVTAASLRFMADVPAGSRLDVLYGDHGIRLSREDAYRSLHFVRDADGRFTSTADLTLPAAAPGPTPIEVHFEATATTLLWAGETVATLPAAPAGPWKIGFRGGMNNLYIDDVVVSGPDGAAALADDFSPRTSWLESFAWAAVLIGLIAGLLALALSRRRRERLAVYATAITFVLLLVGTCGWLADRLVLQHFHGYSTLVFKWRKPFLTTDTTIETPAQARERLRAEAAQSPADQTRVAFVGSSQIWGAGARAFDTHMVSRVERHLTSLTGKPHRTWNTGISGDKSTPLVDSYIADWASWRPHVTVVDLGNNDREPGPFAASLRRLVEHNRTHGVTTALVLEANAPGSPRTTLAGTHEAMRALARELDVPLIDLHGHLTAERETGLVWWDFVHLTDHGQETAARFLAAQIQPLSEGLP